VHRAHGTTRAVLSLVTASIDDLAARVALIADLVEDDATILGSHLEGPSSISATRARTPQPAARRMPPPSPVSSTPAAAPCVR
jgi:N-acetylglucosamine-6-phosphate deacetylase